ncbi:hypothetical protein D8I35_14870 [Corticibacter populi]|uniref:Uncharacterized protein n=1 Tax=Corticibacter populi TaxID=1550736 RepID=A0A3M6QM02_9BURK|nr:hypothetical protein D8I35_14870 [Corticibacter populi]RZS33109.1 hypothetical protein EV687_1427 [Corticibacter populi]
MRIALALKGLEYDTCPSICGTVSSACRNTWRAILLVACRCWQAEGLQVVEVLLQRQHARGDAGPYAFGAGTTQADDCLVPQVANALRAATGLCAG